MSNIDKIRDIQDLIDRAKAVDMAGWRKAQTSLAALSTIDPDAKPQESSDEARIMALNIRGGEHELDENGYWRNNWNLSLSQSAALITAHDDEIRRKCSDRAVDFCSSWNINSEWLRAAILGTEPARESSRAISFDGNFYVFTDPTTGKLESYSSYKSAATALDKILATKPARDGTILNGQWNELQKVINYEPARETDK